MLATQTLLVPTKIPDGSYAFNAWELWKEIQKMPVQWQERVDDWAHAAKHYKNHPRTLSEIQDFIWLTIEGPSAADPLLSNYLDEQKEGVALMKKVDEVLQGRIVERDNLVALLEATLKKLNVPASAA